jgi:hypothetical protein
MYTRITERSGTLSPFHRPCFIAPWYGAVEKRKSFIIKYTVYYYKFLLLLINKDFLRFTRWGSKKIGLLKNTYEKLPKAI